jgi:Na+-translocating ferredoxin:NAD+ oxidoreductase RnfG subunit
MPKNIYKKVSKEIKTVYETEEFTLNGVSISSEMTNQLTTKIDSSNLFQILENKEVKGYAFISKAPSKTDEFDYLVLFDTDFIIKKAKVLVYREDYGAEIGSKRWLKQFIGKKNGETLKYERDIIAISGATISAYSMTVAINNLLESVSVLQKEKAI